MATNMAAIANLGPFKAKKKDPEKIPENSNIYMEAVTNFLTVTDNARAGQEKKKALLKSVGGQDMVFLFKHIGKVPDDTVFDAAITMIRGGITGQTNQAMMRYKLFKDMSQGN